MSAPTLTSNARLVLFDIDGTLISSGGAGERALCAAFNETFGIEDDFTSIEIAGRTDTGIAREILQKHGIAQTDENLSRLLEAYLQLLARLLPTTEGRVLPGVVPLLEALQSSHDTVLGLLTGNLQRGAELKLRHYGIWQFFAFGAFADDHHDRNELGRFAQLRMRERHGIEVSREKVFVIGDTPHDIACARAIGANAIAVATGRSNHSELAVHQPDWVFGDLSDVPAVLAALQ